MRHTHGLPATISNCSNNYGPYQFPEKLIPLMILNALSGRKLPIYGDGGNIRDWLFVEDHCAAIELVLRQGCPGTVSWYLANEAWWRRIKTGAYRDWIKLYYGTAI